MTSTDAAAFCDEIRGRLVGSLYLYCGDRPLAEELAQEALARTWERWDQVSAMASPEAWTFATARNLARSRFRRRAVERRARRSSSMSSSMRPIPTLIALSARLKVCQW